MNLKITGKNYHIKYLCVYVYDVCGIRKHILFYKDFKIFSKIFYLFFLLSPHF